MRTCHSILLTVGALFLVSLNVGCMGRIIGEGVGVVTGASGKVIPFTGPKRLTAYRGFHIESLTVTPGLKTPPALVSLVREELGRMAARKGLSGGAKPTLVFRGEIVNFESAGVVDTAIGPLEEVIVRATLADGENAEVLATANIIGRAKSTSAGGEKRLSEGVGKALGKWLKEGGIEKGEDDEKN